MRIAVSGTHRSGKSSLIEELAARLPKYTTIGEPYRVLEEDGYEFAHPPSLEDFEAQLEQAISSLEEGGKKLLFDRCPVDLLAYATVHEDADSFELDDWLPRVERAMQTIDLVVFVPIESPDRITYARSDDLDGSRAPVDEALREMLLEDSLGLGVEVLEVEGSIEARARAVLQRVG